MSSISPSDTGIWRATAITSCSRGATATSWSFRRRQRGFSAQGFNPALSVPNTNYPGSWPGTVLDANGNLFQSGYPACAGNPFLTRYYGDCSYRYSAATDLLPDHHEISGMAEFTKALPANNQLQMQYIWTQSEVNAWSGPVFYDFTLNPGEPLLPDGCTADMR